MSRLPLLLMLVVGLAGCNTLGDVKKAVGVEETPTTPTAVFSKLPEKYSASTQAIGDEADVADHRAQGLGLVGIPALETYLNGILVRIKSEARLPDIPGRVYITASAKPEVKASADGNIYFSMGMLRNIESEDEVVALLAHEFAHVALGHHDSDAWGNYQKQIQASYALASRLHAGAKSKGATEAPTGKAKKNLNRLGNIIELTDSVLHPAWNRYQEEQADHLAIDLSVRLGYSFSRGQKSILEKLATLEETDKRKRQQDLQARFSEELKTGKLDIEGMLQSSKDEILGMVSRKHEEASERIKSSIAYHEGLYDDLPRPEPKLHSWNRIRETPSVRAVFLNFALADEASAALERDDIRQALDKAQKAAKAPTDGHPYTLLVLLKAQEAAGDSRGHSKTRERLRSIKEPVWQLYEFEAQDELRQGRQDRAAQIMEQGYQRFNHAPSLRPTLKEFYSKIGRKDKSDEIALDCSFRRPVDRKECLDAGGSVKNHGNGPKRGKRWS